MNVVQTRKFLVTAKKLHKSQKSELNNAIKKICNSPTIGEEKKGDLEGVIVYKFYINKQLTLLAYTYNEQTTTLNLLSLGSHQNFYRDLKTSK